MRFLHLRPRLLPVILGLGVVLLGVRVQMLLDHTAPHGAPIWLGDPATAAAEPAANDKTASTPSASPPPTPTGQDDTTQDAAASASIATPTPAAPPAPGDTTDPAPQDAPQETAEDFTDITEFSSSEISLLQSLRKRREELRQREDALVQRERMLKAFEQRIDDKIAELNTIKGDIENTRAAMLEQAKAFEKSKDERIQTLVNVYEKMKPKDAARIFDNLDLRILLDVVRGMKEAKLAPVLAEMNADKATEVTTRLGETLAIPAVAASLPSSDPLTPAPDPSPAEDPASVPPQGEAP